MDRLRQRADFLAVANGARVSGAAFVVQSRAANDDGPIRVGFTVTKKERHRDRTQPYPPPASRIGEAAGVDSNATAQ